ncbi:Highly reducing polyketide synthase, partial [Lachnellula occidentalis]
FHNSVTIKTGCSSSLIYLHMACEALKARQISSAIVSGSNLIMGPTTMFEQVVLSPNGSCRAFDADANGYARGEAINALYVKRLDDALANGDPIRAVIRATASNCDGKTPGIAHPSSESHKALIRSYYESAGLYDYNQTGIVECHGTGTATGDPLEATAVANVFGEKGVYIGSVKPNLGH